MILNKITDINDELIEEAIEYQQKKSPKKAWSPFLKAVSAFCIILVSGVIVVKATNIPVNFFGKTSDKKESKYSITMQSEKISIDEFSEEILGEREVILQQIENAQPWDNQSPTWLQRSFSTQKDAIAYIGYKGLKEHNLDLSEREVKVDLTGRTDGNIQHIRMENFFEKDDIMIQIISEMYTEYADLPKDSSTVIETIDNRYTTYNEENITVGDNQWLVVTCTRDNDSRMNKEAYMIKDKVGYTVNVSYNTQDGEEAETLLKTCMDLF